MFEEDFRGWVKGEYDSKGRPVVPDAEYIWLYYNSKYCRTLPVESHTIVPLLMSLNATEVLRGNKERYEWFWQEIEEVPATPNVKMRK